MLTMQETATVVQGQLMGDNQVYQEVSTDSRTLTNGALFVALRGDRFDGHNYLEEAMHASAAGVMVESQSTLPIPQITVRNTQRALGQLAADWRRRFDIPMVAVTGSNGKTTVKEMIGRILNVRASTLISYGSFNNFIGVPLTLLKLRCTHRFAVVEIGMNQRGEIAHLANLVHPTVSVITNAGAAHLEQLSSVDQVADEKGQLVAALDTSGIPVLNVDSPYFPLWQRLAGSRRQVTFGLHAPADVSADYTPMNFGAQIRLRVPTDTFDVTLHLGGEHNVVNALAAAAAAVALDIPSATIKSGLETMRAVAGRLQLRQHCKGGTLIDDTYNANPNSMRAALKFMAQLTGDRRLVLGDMFELGLDGERFHREVGRLARACGIGRLYALGQLSATAVEEFGRGAVHYTDRRLLLRDLDEQLDATTTLLIKGSRGMRMNELADSICQVDKNIEEAVPC